MTAQDDAAALSSAEKRHLSADSDDNAAQHPKRTRLSPLLQPDVAKAPSPLTGWLDTVLDCFDASEVTPSWEQQPRPDTNKETIHHDDWHANDVSIGTWSHGQASLGSFRSPSHNLQADEIYSNVGQAGYENGIGENLDSDGQLDWGTCAWPEYEAMDLSPAMDFSYEPDEPKNPTIQATLQVPTTLGPSNTSTTRFGMF
ncbi:hypothetical protein LZ32DRAFT_23501 [Colletotrichum eremochloae]|nr:hypothetical protein LZ32DRAFT_23501 [Colletotrichum eremochloae]